MKVVIDSRGRLVVCLLILIVPLVWPGNGPRRPGRQTTGLGQGKRADKKPHWGLCAAVARGRAEVAFDRQPLHFEPYELGDSGTGFVCHSREYDVLLSRGGEYIKSSRDPKHGYIKLSFPGSDRNAGFVGEDILESTSSYFVGADRAHWRSGIPNYSAVRRRGMYPGIDARFHGTGNQVEVDFEIAPGADPSAIKLGFDGATQAALNSRGEVVVRGKGSSELILRKPSIYQRIRGVKEQVVGKYVLRGLQARFLVGSYDERYALVIDPVLSYSSFVGGQTKYSSSFQTAALAAAVDPSGCIYVAGITDAIDFPTTEGALQQDLHNSGAAFVIKLSPQGGHLIYSTYIEGEAQSGATTIALGVAADSRGCAYVCGASDAADFPTTPGAFQTALAGGRNGFVLKLSPSGSELIYSTLLGGGGEFCNGVAVDASGAACVVGDTLSKDFPVTPGAFMNHSITGAETGFVTKVNPDGSGLEFSTYLGGSGTDSVFQPALDPLGNLYVAGRTSSSDFPTTPGAFQRKKKAKVAGFVAKFSRAGDIVYSTLIAGSKSQQSGWIAANAAGELYLTGSTNSSDFPTTAGAFQGKLAGSFDNFVAKFDSQGHSLIFSTFIGGTRDDSSLGIALGEDGAVYIAGDSDSGDYPTTPDAIQRFKRGGSDVVVSKLSEDGSTLVYSTYIGGEHDESANAIAVDDGGNAVIAGETRSSRFPTTDNAIRTHTNALPSGFVCVIEPSDFTVSLTPPSITLSVGSSSTVGIEVVRTGGLRGRIQVTPSTIPSAGIRVSPSHGSATPSRNASFEIRAKENAVPGQYAITFSTADARNVIHHTVTLNVEVQ